MKALYDARKQMSSVIVQWRLNKAASSLVPSAADSNFRMGYTRSVYRSEEYKCVGPYLVINYDHKHIQIDYNDRIVVVTIDRCKKYRAEKDTQDTLLHDDSLPNDVFRDDTQNIDNEDLPCTNVWNTQMHDNVPFETFPVKAIP